MSDYGPTFEDAFNLLCGDKLGSGIHRDVFECRLLPDCVVKVENDGHWRYFANVKEMSFWSDWQHCERVSKWLAPCEFMSPDGRVLVQKRVRIAHPTDTMPDKLPKFLADRKLSNYGWLGDRFVCVDYGITIPEASTRMTKAEWRA